jgi:two-component system, OmpR family, sensor kinase
MRRLGYKARLVAWHAIVLAVILSVSALALDWTARRIVLDQFDAALMQAAQSVAAEIGEEGPTSPVHAMPVRPVRRLLWTFRPIIQIVDEQGGLATLIGARQPITLPSAVLDRIRQGKVTFKTFTTEDAETLRMVGLRADHERAFYWVLVAHPVAELQVLLHRLRLLVVASAVVILLTTVLTDMLLTRRVLRPLEAIVGRARTLGESNLSERLPHPGEPGELAQLVETLNDMLSRLEDGFEAQRRFTADAAHELRSPLTRLRTEIEVAMRRPRDLEEYQRILALTLEEIQRLGGLTENLLALARLDSGEGREVTSRYTRLASVVDGVVARFSATAKAKHIALCVDPAAADVAVRLAASMVEVIVANVIDNAIKFSPAGSRVDLNVVGTGDEAVITIADRGPGIPVDELPHVFERFYRGRLPRAVGASGVGLGLAIVHTLVERQHGRIDIESEVGLGTEVTIRLPIADHAHTLVS